MSVENCELYDSYLEISRSSRRFQKYSSSMDYPPAAARRHFIANLWSVGMTRNDPSYFPRPVVAALFNEAAAESRKGMSLSVPRKCPPFPEIC